MEGLTTTMVPKNLRRNCWHFYPPADTFEDPSEDIVVAAEPQPDVFAGVLWEPTEVEYEQLFPAVYLTPLLVEPRSERLVQPIFSL